MQECPSEWEKITEGKDVLQVSTHVVELSFLHVVQWYTVCGSVHCIIMWLCHVVMSQAMNGYVSPKQEEQQDSDSETGLEIIEEVGTDTATAAPTTEAPANDNEMDIEEDKDEGETEDTSLAAAAAAYAQIRSTIGSVGQEGLGLTEPEVAIVSVLASFLAVHPLGATINEITMYFQGFNPSYNSHYLESLLRRLSKVFQLSAGTGGLPGKWWFMGFQTCYSAVGDARSGDQELTSTTDPATETTTEEASKDDS